MAPMKIALLLAVMALAATAMASPVPMASNCPPGAPCPVPIDPHTNPARIAYAKQFNITLAPTIVDALPLAACSATQFLLSTDLQGGDLIPTIMVPTPTYSHGFPDRVAAASSAAACCNLCALEADCGAFTFGPASDCATWIPGAPGCCYMKYASGWDTVSSPATRNYTSGVLPTKAPSAPPTYTLTVNSDTAGADLALDSAMPDLVVPASTAAECAAACALVPECKAFTLASSAYCAYRLGDNVPGCCYLKPANGWNATAAPGLVSGVLEA